mgnify:CR=1 FL=1
MDKVAVIRAVIEKFRATMADHESAAGAAREGATGDEVSSDGKYDTRATEASYLARGHAMQYEAMLEDLRTLEAYRVPDYESDEEIGTGALVEVTVNRAKNFYFILPRGGGIDTAFGKHAVTVINARSPIARELKGKYKGDTFLFADGQMKGKIANVC